MKSVKEQSVEELETETIGGVAKAEDLEKSYAALASSAIALLLKIAYLLEAQSQY